MSFQKVVSSSWKPRYWEARLLVFLWINLNPHSQVLRKHSLTFYQLQVKVYDLLKQKGGYSRKTSRTLISSLPGGFLELADLDDFNPFNPKSTQLQYWKINIPKFHSSQYRKLNLLLNSFLLNGQTLDFRLQTRQLEPR